jgi:hypothetical protein
MLLMVLKGKQLQSHVYIATVIVYGFNVRSGLQILVIDSYSVENSERRMTEEYDFIVVGGV